MVLATASPPHGSEITSLARRLGFMSFILGLALATSTSEF